MSLWFYVWIITSITFGIYIFYHYLKSPKYFKVRLWDHSKALELKDNVEERFVPAKNWKTHLMVISQWLLVTLFLGFVLFIFSEDSYLPEIIVCADEKYVENYAENLDEVNIFLGMSQKLKNEDSDYQMGIILCDEMYKMYTDEFIKKYK